MNRKILASLLIIGVTASVATGATFALFNDTESSESNVFTAGAIDLKVDWNESYNGVSQENQTLTDIDGESIFTLDDVKPGDEGEATLSMHVYDNPGYIWMRWQPENHTDVTCTEPEAKAEMAGTDENGNPAPGCDGEGEIKENLNYTLWYDDGDNVFEEDEEPIPVAGGSQVCRPGETVDVALALDTSGSMEGSKLTQAKSGSKTLVDSLNNSDQSALVSFTSTASLEQELTTNKTAVKNEIDSLTDGGGTDIATGVSAGHTELINGTNARANASKVMVVLSDGQGGDPEPAADAAKADGVRVITIALGSGADTQTLEEIASSQDDAYVSPSASELEQVFQDISGTICEQTSSLEDGILLDADPTTEEVEPFENSTTRYVGFKWNLPLDVGNEAQTDRFEANLDFYAEQARNNPAPENPWG